MATIDVLMLICDYCCRGVYKEGTPNCFEIRV